MEINREERIKRIMSGKAKGVFPSVVRLFLTFFSWIYGLIVSFRNWFFDRGLFRTYRPTAKLIISVGNIVAGGTGKTPFTVFLAKTLSNFPLAILSRGYRSASEKKGNLIVLHGEHPVEECGDEPLMLAKALPNATIVVCADRKKSADEAIKRGADILLLDDGMQHRSLSRDIDIAIVDIQNPLGFGHLLPRGLLRENPKGLKRAKLIVVNRVDCAARFIEVQFLLRKYSEAPIIGAQLKVDTISDFDGQQISSLKEVPVAVLCAIAQPNSFKNTVESIGAKIVNEKILSDHSFIDPELLDQFAKESLDRGAKAIVCTEKDLVKIAKRNYLLPIYCITVRIEIVEGKAEWAAFLQNLVNKLEN